MLFRQMESEILKHLPRKPTLDEVYAQIGGEDVVVKRIEMLLEEDARPRGS